MTNVSLDGDESLSQQQLSPGENMGDLILPQLEERIETLKEMDVCLIMVGRGAFGLIARWDSCAVKCPSFVFGSNFDFGSTFESF